MASTSYLSNMNPDDMEGFLKTFLEKNDKDGNDELIINDTKYKVAKPVEGEGKAKFAA